MSVFQHKSTYCIDANDIKPTHDDPVFSSSSATTTMPRAKGGSKRELSMLNNIAIADAKMAKRLADCSYSTPPARGGAFTEDVATASSSSNAASSILSSCLRPRQLSNKSCVNSSDEEEDYFPPEEESEHSSSSDEEVDVLVVVPVPQTDEMSSITEESPTTTKAQRMYGDNILVPWLETKSSFEDFPCPKCLGKVNQRDNSCAWKHSLVASAYSHGALSDIVISCSVCSYERVVCSPGIVWSKKDDVTQQQDHNSCASRRSNSGGASRNKKYNRNKSKFKEYPINYGLVLLTQLLGGGTDNIAVIFAFLGLAPSYGGYDKWKALEDIVGESEQSVSEEVCTENIQSTLLAYQDSAKEQYSVWLATMEGQQATQEAKISKMQQLLHLKDGRVGIRVGMDGAWQRRAIGFGSGNSKSGHNFCVDLLTKKIVNAVVYSKQCTTCKRWKKSGKPVPVHRCSKNFDGSAKSMEAEASIQHKVDLETKDTGVYIHTLCTDDDSSVRANTKYSHDDIARRDYPDYHGRNKHITDWPYTETTVNGKTSRTYAKDTGHLPLQCYPIHRYITDKNHRVRCIGKFLFSKELQSKAKTTPPGKMSKEEALKLKKYAGYYLKQDTNLQLPFTEFCRRAPCMYLHHFNDHHLCDIKWCKILQSQRTDGVQPTVLPAGYLRQFRHRENDKKLFDKLEELYTPYLSKEPLWQCYHGDDTNKNESLNRKCTAVAPKDKYLSGTKSLEDRLCLVVVIDSVGYVRGMKRVLSKIGIDMDLVAPVVAEWSSRLDNKKAKQAAWRKKPEVKRRRVEATNAAIKAWSLGDRAAAKQGKVYESGSAMDINRAIELIVEEEENPIDLEADATGHL